MSRYRDAWVTVTAVTGTVGACVAFMTWTVPGVLGAFTGAAIVGGGMTATLQPVDDPRPWRRVGIGAVATGLTVIAIGGLLVVLGVAAVPLVLVLGLSAPPVWSALRRWLSQHGMSSRAVQEPKADVRPRAKAAPSPRPARVSEPETATEPELPQAEIPKVEPLDDCALCLAWRRSYIILQKSHTPATRLRAVQVRQVYLDELERRNPNGLSAWLASGARAAGNPTPFILHRSSTSTHGAD